MRKPRNEQGLKDLQREFGVVTTPGKTGPFMRDVHHERGAFCYVPVQGVAQVMPFSDDKGSPAKARGGAGRVYTKSKSDDQVFPESQIPGSRTVTPA